MKDFIERWRKLMDEKLNWWTRDYPSYRRAVNIAAQAYKGLVTNGCPRDKMIEGEIRMALDEIAELDLEDHAFDLPQGMIPKHNLKPLLAVK